MRPRSILTACAGQIQRIKALVLVGIADLAIGLAQFASGVHIGEKWWHTIWTVWLCRANCPLVACWRSSRIRPAGVVVAGSQMEVTTHGPHARSFLLRLVQTSLQAGTHASERIDANGFHQPVLLK